MKSQLTLKKALLTILFVLGSVLVFAQATGKIAGTVSDKKTGETLIGVSVKLAGTTKGVGTDVEGRYLLGGLAAGKYTIEISYVSYATKKITDVEVKAGAVTTLNVVMEEASSQTLQTVTITASVKQESVNTLYLKQKTNVSISDGISADQIKRSPDRNTSEVLKRVSGTSIQDNKFVIVRGLSDRYNSTLLNNAILPSSEPDRKAFSFDIIPSNMIDNIVINKTASPDLPGDFSGGVVQVLTKDIPSENYVNFSVGTGYNSQSTFKKFYLGDKNGVENFGYFNSNRNIPQGIPSTQNYTQLTTNQKIDAGKLFNNSFRTHQFNGANPAQAYQMSVGLRKNLKDNASIGSIISLTYRNGESKNISERLEYEGQTKQYDYNDDSYKFSSSVGALANFAYVKKNNKIAFKNLYNVSLDNSYTSRYGTHLVDLDSIRGYSYDLVSKSLLNTQLEGEHKLNWNDLKVNWNMGYSYSDRLQPDLKSLTYRLDYDQGATVYEAVVPNGTASRTDASRFFSQLFEDSYNAGLNLSLPFSFLKDKSTFKLGGMKQYKLRDFKARKFGYIKSFGSFESNLLTLPYNEIFAPANLKPTGFVMDEGTENADKYDAISDLNAGYAMVDTRFSKKLRASFGARIEDSYQQVNTADFSGKKVKVEKQYFDVLPSMNTTFNLNDKTNLRLSASQTVTRPELRELSNFGFFDYISKRILVGNPDLKRSQNTNIDVKYEVFPSAGQIISLSGYYKYFKNPIEQVVSSGSVKNITFQNANSAKTYGLELEIRKNLSFINKENFFNNVTAYVNSSVIFSTVNLNSLVSEITSRALQGQSPYLINAGLMYSEPTNGLSFNLLYNRIGQRISEVGYQGYADIYEKGRNVVDFQLSKKMMKNKGELRLNLTDILNEKIIFYQNNNTKNTYQQNVDNIMNTARTGAGVSLSFIYNFSLDKK
ncbi:TonB-dependent receptor [Pedobacter sp. UBA4863]|uniref:TonB-dependent receptor n=1 Tax=Pedobacter sp. UBA4863 TaxID=1947060 RepID=UPI0025F7FCA0|nr:TonB-dependent receptor [Pedobacter sp. UBA4863]